MSDIQTFHDNLIKGKLNKLVFDEILYDNFSWIYHFAMLRHQHYALSWTFNTNSNMDDFALYSLLINKHDVRAKEIIETYVLNNGKIYLNSVLQVIRPEWLPSASRDMCILLLNSFPDDAHINYFVATWSIVSDYEIPNLKYSKDHKRVYESLNKTIPSHEYKIKVERSNPFYLILDGEYYDNKVHSFGDYDICIGDKTCCHTYQVLRYVFASICQEPFVVEVSGRFLYFSFFSILHLLLQFIFRKFPKVLKLSVPLDN